MHIRPPEDPIEIAPRILWSGARLDGRLAMPITRWYARPAPSLAPFIDRYWGWESVMANDPCVEDSLGVLPARILPGTGAECVFHYRSPFRLNESSNSAVLIAPRTGPVSLASTGSIGFVAVRFRSGRLRHFCNVPLAAIHDGEWPVSDIWGDDAGALHASLVQAGDHQTRIQALNRFFLERLALFYQQRSAQFDAVLDLLYYSPSTTVEQLTERSGWTRRHLLRKFNDYYGIAPKRFARLARLNHTMRALALDIHARPLDVALRMGYFDQAHFIHETRSLTSLTPGDIVPALQGASHFYNPPSRPIG